MRIVQLVPYDMDRPGGVQRHVRDLAHWLTCQGHVTRIVCPPAPGGRAGTQGDITRIGRARMLGAHGTRFEISWAAPREIRALAADLQYWGADLVHAHTPWTPMIAAQVMRALRLPVVATVHATLPRPDAAGLTDRYIRRAARRILPRCAEIVTPSSAPQAMLRALLPNLRPVILPPAIDLAPWAAASAPRDPGALSLVCLGRLEPRKGVGVLLDAWPRIAAALPDAHLTIAGDGPLRAQVAAAPGPRLTHAARPTDAEARALVGHADILLAPAPYGESFGLILAEALAAGALPVAAANPGYASVLTGAFADLLALPGDPGALADTVIALGSDAARRADLRALAPAHAASFDIAAQGPAYLDLYRRALAS